MKLKYLYILLFLPVLLNAQQLKRWTFCGVGGTGTVSITNNQKIIVASTFGQCPGCTVISDGKTTLRQGFQQPITVDNDTTKTGGTNPKDCLFKVDFASKSKTDNCGTYFDFEYQGDVLPGMTYSWDFGVDAVPKTSTAANPTKIGFSNAGVQVIRLTVTNKTCNKTQSTIVNVATKSFVAQSQVSNILCYGKKTGFASLAVSGATQPVTYQWSNGATTKDLTNVAAGKYKYAVTDGKGCISQADIEIKQPNDSITIVKDTKDESCKDAKDGEINLTITGGTAPYNYTWNDGAFTKDRENLIKGLYVVTITDKNKCQNGAVIDLKRYCDKTEKDFENTFSPNGDGVNDAWTFDGLDNFPKNEVQIFNRWGSLVWNKKSVKNGDWAGQTNNGELLPSGPYYYLIKLNDRDNTVFAGAVTIIR
jgi:gliding motility-associated-like protein